MIDKNCRSINHPMNRVDTLLLDQLVTSMVLYLLARCALVFTSRPSWQYSCHLKIPKNLVWVYVDIISIHSVTQQPHPYIWQRECLHLWSCCDGWRTVTFWKTSECLSTVEWINTFWYIHTTDYYAATKVSNIHIYNMSRSQDHSIEQKKLGIKMPIV
jgi:hypothetical protein